MSIFARAIRPYHSSMSKVGLSTAAISSQLSNTLIPKALSTCSSSGFIYRSCSSSTTTSSSSSCSNSSDYGINNSSAMLARTMLGSCRLPQSQIVRSYVSSNRDGKKNNNNRNNSRGNKSGEQNLPDFQSLMRTFYKKAHPDIIRSYDADKAAINDASFQIINNLLSTIKQANNYPAAMVKRIPFYLRDANTKSIVQYELTLKAAGGDCRYLFIKCFSEFFRSIGIMTAAEFSWNKDYFPPTSMAEVSEVMMKEAEDRLKEQQEEENGGGNQYR